ncbi:MAG: YbhB/YbcL family Raf kinase inhibitor-like protein [Bacteroidales bacterium]|nr:YbhB/YbcL family Raf kinase inhibitor-like protein [Bacteroidales bacterium]
MSFELRSRSFEPEALIPVEYTCKGDDTSPHLDWDGAPPNTVTYALIMEDPDAPEGIFTHWIIYNIPAKVSVLEPVVSVAKNLDNGACHGKNDFGKYGYRGPCPPKGEKHRYLFRLFALKCKLPRESAGNRDEFYTAIENNVIDKALYVGIFKR